MPNPASYTDIENRWRPLFDPDLTIANTRLDDAWRKLKNEVPSLESRMANSADLTDDVVRVLSDAVIRVLQSNARNGLRKGAVGVDDGSTSWELDASIRTGLYFTDDELSDLSATPSRRGPKAYSVQPS